MHHKKLTCIVSLTPIDCLLVLHSAQGTLREGDAAPDVQVREGGREAGCSSNSLGPAVALPYLLSSNPKFTALQHPPSCELAPLKIAFNLQLYLVILRILYISAYTLLKTLRSAIRVSIST